MKTVNNHQVADIVLTASNLISLFLKDKLVRELSELDTTIGKIEITYEIVDHAPTNYAVLFTATIDMFDHDIEEFLSYESKWHLNAVQVLEWANNRHKFDDYRVKP